MPTINFEAMTDANGAYSVTQVFNPPGPFSIEVSDLRARLVSPADTTIVGTFDVDGVGGGPQNTARNYSIATGQEVSLGGWRLSGGDNRIVVAGTTSPPRPGTQIRIEVNANLGF